MTRQGGRDSSASRRFFTGDSLMDDDVSYMRPVTRCSVSGHEASLLSASRAGHGVRETRGTSECFGEVGEGKRCVSNSPMQIWAWSSSLPELGVIDEYLWQLITPSARSCICL